MKEWISVLEKLPNKNQDIIAGGYFDNEWQQEIGFVSEIDIDLCDGHWIDFWFKVSHWLPIPNPPKK